jgi:hypothetical protein
MRASKSTGPAKSNQYFRESGTEARDSVFHFLSRIGKPVGRKLDLDGGGRHLEGGVGRHRCPVPYHRLKMSLRYRTVSCMSTVQEIESAIDRLPQADLLALVDRIRGRHSEAWDRQIEADAQNGRLDALYARLAAENRSQPEIPLDEVLDDGKLP